MKKSHIAVFISCLTVMPAAQASSFNNDAILGAIIGSAAGAAIGSAAGNRQGAVIGAGLGGAIGVAMTTPRREYHATPRIIERHVVVAHPRAHYSRQQWRHAKRHHEHYEYAYMPRGYYY